jgi:zinc protease
MKNLITIIFLCAAFTLHAQTDRTKAPKAGPASKVQIGTSESFVLPNGLKVFVTEDHKLPRVSYSLSFNIVPELEGKNAGISSITSDLIGTKTQKRTKDQIDEETDFISASLSAGEQGIYASSLKKHTAQLLDLMSDISMNSEFTTEELEKVRKQKLSALAAAKDDPNSIAGNVSSALMYGKQHPYGESENEESVKSITLDMCKQYYDKYFCPNIAYMSVVGDITLPEAKKLIEQYFSSWKRKEVQVVAYTPRTAPVNNKIFIVDRPNAVQSVINICYPLELSLSNPDYIKAKVVNTILGGGTFRLFTNLREKHAYTYGAYSSISVNPLASGFKAYCSARNEVTDSSVYQILSEMKRICNEPVKDDELQMVKNYLSGNFALSLENPQTIASFAVNIERNKLPKDFYTNYLKNLNAVTIEDVQAIAKKYIRPENANILVVGKATGIAESLKKYSSDGKIVYLDIDGNPYDPSSLKKVIPEGVTVKKILENYVLNVGGKDNYDKVTDLSINAEASMQGMVLKVNTYFKPDKFLTEITVNGQAIQKQIYNNGKGKSSGMQGTKEITGNELEKLKLDAEILPELKYESLGYKTELKSIVTLDGEDTYSIEITSPAGDISTDYFSVKTGLKVKSVSTEDTPNGKITKTTILSDYQKTNDILMPHKISITVGPQSFDILVKSVNINTGIKDDIFSL